MNFFSLDWAETFILGFTVLIILVLALPYSYTFARLISKAWYKSKNEERSY